MESTLVSLDDSCLNFQITSQQDQTNKCAIQPHLAKLRNSSETTNRSCVQCDIRYVDVLKKDDCSRNLDCAKLDFENNLVFEQFFRQHRDSIANRYPEESSETSSLLIIAINNYNLTRITPQYIGPLLNISVSSLQTMLILKQQSPGLTFPPIVNGSFPLQNEVLNMYIDCPNGGNSIRYQMGKSFPSPKRTLKGECSVIQTTSQPPVNSTTSPNVEIILAEVELVAPSTQGTTKSISTVTTPRRAQTTKRAPITTAKPTTKKVAIVATTRSKATTKKSSTSTNRSTVSRTTEADLTTLLEATTATTIRDQSPIITIELSTAATNSTLKQNDSVQSATTEMDQVFTSMFVETTIRQTQRSNEVESTSASLIILPGTTEIRSTDSTSTTSTAKSNSIVLYIVLGLFLLLLGIAGIALAAFYLCCYGRRRNPFADQLLNGMSETTNTDDTNPASHQPSTSSGMSRTPSTAFSTRHDESRFFMKPSKSYAHTFNDDTF